MAEDDLFRLQGLANGIDPNRTDAVPDKQTPIGRPVSRGKYAPPRRNEIASSFKLISATFVLQILIVPVSSLC
jgi:hypothetical protein